MRRLAAALLIFVAAGGCRKSPEDLYAQGRNAILRGETARAEEIAREGEKRFAKQPEWRELFGILEAEVDRTHAAAILQRTAPSGATVPMIRRLMLRAALGENPDQLYGQADALAARAAPQLRPEIAARRILFAKDQAEATSRAEEAIRGATALHQTWLVASAHNFLGKVKVSSGNWQKAIDEYTLAYRYARVGDAPALVKAALVNLGWAYMESGDYEQALSNLHAGLTLAEQQNDPFHKHMALTHIADVYERRIELTEALKYATRALEVAKALGPLEQANSFHQLAQIQLERGDYKSAAALNEKAHEQRAKTQEDDRHERVIDARLLAANGNPAGAIETLSELLVCYDLDTPTRWRAEGLSADIYAQLGQFENAKGMYEATLATGTKARAQLGGTGSMAFERNLLGFYDRYIQMLIEEGDVTDALLVAERSRARVLKEKIGYDSADDVDPVAIARRKNATILCYWLAATRSLVWSVRPEGVVDVATLPADEELDRMAEAYRSQLKLRRSTLDARLFETLVAPAKVATHRVIILPDSHLNALPFETLVTNGKDHYWIEDVTISYSPSLHLLAARPQQTSGVNGLLVFGDVPETPQFPALPNAPEEIKAITSHFDSTQCEVVRGAAATPASYFAKNPSHFRFIHFAAHGTADATTPLDSSVILAGGALKGTDIVQHRLNADLVTISSCDSAGQHSYAGEGLVGVAWAFLGAGAHRVIAAQWAVVDSVAPHIMDAMYRDIARGIDPAEALRTAKLELLKDDYFKERPNLWAPFVLYEAM